MNRQSNQSLSKLNYALAVQRLLAKSSKYSGLKSRLETIAKERMASGLKAEPKQMANALAYAIGHAFHFVPIALKKSAFETHQTEAISPISRLRLILQSSQAKMAFSEAMNAYVPRWSFKNRLKGIDQKIVELLKGKKDAKVADIGCARGETTEEMAVALQKFAKVQGFDISLQGTPKKGHAMYFEHDILKGPLKEKFDIARTANLTFYFTHEGREIAQKNILQSLKEEGYWVLVEVKKLRVYQKKENRFELVYRAH